MLQCIGSIASKSIASRYPSEVKYWDVKKNIGLTANQVNAMSNVSYWWLCPLGHSYKAAPANRLYAKTSCPICAGRKLLTGYNDLTTLYPELSAEWDIQKSQPLTPQKIYARSCTSVWWKCDKGHSYQISPSKRVHNNAKCPYCSGKLTL